MKSIKENLELVETIIVQGAKKFNRCVDDINLVAVSKKQPIDRIYEMLQCSHRLYGENRVQEAQDIKQSIATYKRTMAFAAIEKDIDELTLPNAGILVQAPPVTHLTLSKMPPRQRS